MNRTRDNSRRLLPLATAVMLLCFSLPGFAATLEAYKARIDSAAKLSAEVEQVLTEDRFDASLTQALVDRVRRDFPSSERVEWPGGSAEISSEWLLARTAELDKADTVDESLPVVLAIREHLSAVAYKLGELENVQTPARTKDEDKQKLAEILRREEYQKPQDAQESAFQRWLREFFDWLASIWPTPSGATRPLTGMESLVSVLRIVLFVALAALLAFLVFKIVPLVVPNLKRTRKPKSKQRVILGEQIGEDEVASDLFSQAEHLARAGDLRGAIRKGYIALLCDLSDRRIIGLARNKTNRDYLRDVRSRRELHPRMLSATEMFERHWYGLQRSEEQDWRRFSEEYHAAIRSA
jgi:hypothetical protein